MQSKITTLLDMTHDIVQYAYTPSTHCSQKTITTVLRCFDVVGWVLGKLSGISNPVADSPWGYVLTWNRLVIAANDNVPQYSPTILTNFTKCGMLFMVNKTTSKY